MRSFAASLLMLVSGAYAGAQQQPVDAVPNELPDGKVEVSVRNLSSQPMTGFILVAEHAPLINNVRPHTTVRYVDSVFNWNDRPLMGKDTQTFTFGGPGPGGVRAWHVEVTLKAAIFADGLPLVIRPG